MNTPLARSARFLIAVGMVVVALATTHAGAAEARVGLGTADSFAVLAATTVTNTGASTVSGDLGVSPGDAVVGFPPGQVTNGVIHAGDAVAAQAQSDLTAAYNDAAGRQPSATGLAELGNQRLVAGVYAGSSLSLTGTLTLDAQGDPNAVFIFQAGETLTTAAGSRVEIVNGAQACNVFWQIGSSATIGTDSVFVGSVLALTSVTATTRATVHGRLLARNGAVTLDSNTITVAGCAPTATTSTTVPATTSTTAAEATTTTAPGATTGTSTGDIGSPSPSGGQPTTVTQPSPPVTAAATTPGGSAGSGGQTARTNSRGGSADSSRSTEALADTGSSATGTTVVGLLMLVAGVVILLLARWTPARHRAG